MGSKAPPPGKPPLLDPREDGAVGHPPSADHLARKASLKRIADALQVSPAALYQPVNMLHEASGAGKQASGEDDHGAQCRALVHAFMLISDPEERRGILELVQASADKPEA